MARPGSPTVEDSSVGFDLLIGAGAFAATILVEALQARISVIPGPAPAGFTGQFVLGLTVLAALLFAGYWLAAFQRKSYAPTAGVEVVRDRSESSCTSCRRRRLSKRIASLAPRSPRPS